MKSDNIKKNSKGSSILPLDFFYTLIFSSSIFVFISFLYMVMDLEDELALPLSVLISVAWILLYFWWQKNSGENQ